MKNENTAAVRRRNRLAYIAEAGLEYFISLLVTGAFLAALLKHIGFSDAASGIVTSLASLGFLAQAAVLMLKPRRSPKRLVTALHLANQIMFVFLYMIPFINIPHGVKVAMFAAMLLGGHLLSNTVMPLKLSWLMSFVDDSHRGEFTANKEIVSLVGGIVFSYVMGAVSDRFTDAGHTELAFLICGITLFALTVLHLLSLLAVKDAGDSDTETAYDSRTAVQAIKSVFSGSDFTKIILIDVLWHMGSGISVSYFGVYQIQELGFSLRYVAILNAVHSVVRVLFSRFFGRFADKYSWRTMMTVSLSIGAVGYLLNAFTVPSNGKIMFMVYYIFYAVYMAGSNSGIMNLTFDYVKTEDRACALGIKSAIGGMAGFLASLCGAKIVSAVQGSGNLVMGHTIYAQQILSFLTFIIYIAAAIYVKNAIHKINNNNIKRSVEL